jgi:hypothetical protein
VKAVIASILDLKNGLKNGKREKGGADGLTTS